MLARAGLVFLPEQDPQTGQARVVRRQLRDCQRRASRTTVRFSIAQEYLAALRKIAGCDNIQQATLPLGKDFRHAKNLRPLAAGDMDQGARPLGHQIAAARQEGHRPGFVEVREHLLHRDGPAPD